MAIPSAREVPFLRVRGGSPAQGELRTPTRARSTYVDCVDEKPDGYMEPFLVWAVETIRGLDGSIQFGVFTTEAEAQGLVDQLTAEGYVNLHLNMLPVHSRVIDWEYDR